MGLRVAVFQEATSVGPFLREGEYIVLFNKGHNLEKEEVAKPPRQRVPDLPGRKRIADSQTTCGASLSRLH